MLELIFLFFKIIVALLVVEGIMYGVVMIILLKLINDSHKEDEERVRHEGD